MKTERKSEITARLVATAPDGRELAITERTEYVRELYAEGWSNWAQGTRTFWLGAEKLKLLNPCELQDRTGTTLTLAPPGVVRPARTS